MAEGRKTKKASQKIKCRKRRLSWMHTKKRNIDKVGNRKKKKNQKKKSNLDRTMRFSFLEFFAKSKRLLTLDFLLLFSSSARTRIIFHLIYLFQLFFRSVQGVRLACIGRIRSRLRTYLHWEDA